MKRKLFTGLAVLLCLLLLGFGYWRFTAEKTDVPQEIQTLIEETLKNLKDDRAAALSNIHFEPEYADEEELILGVKERILDYELKSVDRISDDLYAVTYTSETSYSPGTYETHYGFVGKIDGQYRYVLTRRNLPKSLLEKLPEDQYVNQTLEEGGKYLYP